MREVYTGHPFAEVRLVGLLAGRVPLWRVELIDLEY